MKRMSTRRKLTLAIVILAGLALLTWFGGSGLMARLAEHLHGGAG